MRVLLLSWEYPPHCLGGLGRHVKRLAPVLAEMECEIHVVTPNWADGEPQEQKGNLHIHRVAPPKIYMPDVHTGAWQTNLELGRYIEKLITTTGSFDLIHAHDWSVAFSAIALKQSFKIPLLVTIHATERGRNRGHVTSNLHRAINQVEWWATFEAWRVICCSEYMAQELREFFSLPEDKLDIIPNGVNVQDFVVSESESCLALFRNMYARSHEKIVLYLGRLVYEKGVHVLIEAIPRILSDFPNVKFVIAGRGPMLDALRQRTWELNIANKVLFAGLISDIDRNRLYHLASCAVFPSLYEPFGIVALEAMASRTPVVVSDRGGFAEVVSHSEDGLVVPAENVEALAGAVLQVLTEPRAAQERVECAYRMVSTKYTWQHIARQTRAVYDRVVRERADVSW